VRFAQAVAELGGHRCLATLVAFAAVMPQVAADEAIALPAEVLGRQLRATRKPTDTASVLWVGPSGSPDARARR
jgi:hypothetical protein